MCERTVERGARIDTHTEKNSSPASDFWMPGLLCLLFAAASDRRRSPRSARPTRPAGRPPRRHPPMVEGLSQRRARRPRRSRLPTHGPRPRRAAAAAAMSHAGPAAAAGPGGGALRDIVAQVFLSAEPSPTEPPPVSGFLGVICNPSKLRGPFPGRRRRWYGGRRRCRSPLHVIITQRRPASAASRRCATRRRDPEHRRRPVRPHPGRRSFFQHHSPLSVRPGRAAASAAAGPHHERPGDARSAPRRGRQ